MQGIPVSACLKTHIKTLDGVRQGTYGDVVDALLGIVADGVEGDASAGFRLVATGNDVDGLLGVGHAEVVEHDAVYAAVVEHLLQFVEGADLNLNLQLEVLLFQIVMAAVDGIDDAAGEVDVVVLEQDHVEQSDAVVAASANLHGLLLEHAHAGGGLAGVEHAGLGALQPLDILVGHGGNAAHALHDVEHESLGLQQGAHATGDNHGDVALLDARAVLHEHLDLHVGVEAAEHFLGDLDAGQDAVFLDEQTRSCPWRPRGCSTRWYGRRRRCPLQTRGR